ncbi:hypothetical protein [Streptomyces sp. NPDC055210]
MVTKNHVGRKVTNGERVGTLMVIMPDQPDELSDNKTNLVTVGFVRPIGGGIEWSTNVHSLSPTR